MSPPPALVPDLPGGWPLLGHLPAFRRDPLALLRRVAAQPGPLWQLRLGTRRVVVASSPEVAEALLVRLAPALEKGPLVRSWSRPLLGEGLISCPTADHAEHRAQLAPAFSAARREAMLGALAGNAAAVLARFPEGPFDVGVLARELVAAVVGPALVAGLDATAWASLFAALDTVNRHQVARIRNPLLPAIGGPTPGARRAGAALRRLDRAIEDLIRRRAERERTGSAGQAPSRAPRAPDLLDVLLDARAAGNRPLSPSRLRDELVTFLAAGYETTATALTWTLALLALHPDVAAEVRDEARSAARGEPCPAAADLPALVRCEQVIKESLRLWPPVHTLGRQTREEVHLCGHTLPPGTILAFSTYLLHRRPDLYPDPDRFRPDRFARPEPRSLEDGAAASSGPDRVAARFRYLPFGAGPRACIGGDLALATLKLLVAGITAHHDLHPAPGLRLTPELLVTLRPRGPLRVRFSPRRRAPLTPS